MTRFEEKQEFKFVTVLTFYLVMWSLKLNYKDLISCQGFFLLFIVFSETTCYFHEKKEYHFIQFIFFLLLLSKFDEFWHLLIYVRHFFTCISCERTDTCTQLSVHVLFIKIRSVQIACLFKYNRNRLLVLSRAWFETFRHLHRNLANVNAL